jgi:hypothetical protein
VYVTSGVVLNTFCYIVNKDLVSPAGEVCQKDLNEVLLSIWLAGCGKFFFVVLDLTTKEVVKYRAKA